MWNNWFRQDQQRETLGRDLRGSVAQCARRLAQVLPEALHRFTPLEEDREPQESVEMQTSARPGLCIAILL